MKALFLSVSLLFGASALANVSTDEPVPLSHCYHWLESDKGYLNFKYDYAKKNGNELTFFTSPETSNGSVAGQGLYCAKSPSGSYAYGNRVIRIEFVRDVVVFDETEGKNICGHDGHFYAKDADCQKKDWDVKLYTRNPDWYVIQNPRAVMSWSASSPELVQDLQNESGDDGYPTKAQETIALIEQDVAKNGVRNFVNTRARLGFAKLIKSDALLNSMPALAILSMMNSAEAKKADPARLAEVLEATVARVLQDNTLNWSDVNAVLVANKSLKKNLVDGAQKQIAQVTAGKVATTNYRVLIVLADQEKDSFNANQMQVLVAGLFKDPKNLQQTRFAKKNLTATLVKTLQDEVARQMQLPKTASNMSLIVSLMGFSAGNGLDKDLQTNLVNLFQEYIKGMGPSEYFLVDGKYSYPLGDSVAKALELCPAQVQAYKLINKKLSLKVRKLQVEAGKVLTLSGSAAFCQGNAELLTALSQISTNTADKVLVFKGKIQDLPYTFVAVDQETLLPQVSAFVKRNNLKDVDTITFSINGSEERYLVNGNTVTGDAIGKAFTENLEEEGLHSRTDVNVQAELNRRSQGKGHKIVIGINLLSFKFTADTLEDFDDKCKVLAPSITRIPLGDDASLLMSIDDNSVNPTENPASPWQPTETCKVLHTAVRSSMKSKMAQEIINNKGKYRYSFDGSVSDTVMTFAVNSLSEFDVQCKKLVGEIPAPYSSTGVNVLFGNVQHTIDSDNYLQNPKEACDLIKKGTFGHIPSAEQISILNVKAKYRIDANIGGYPVTFNVSSKDQLLGQCLNLLEELPNPGSIENVPYKLNGVKQSPIYTDNGYSWENTRDICRSFKSGVGFK